MKLLNLTFKTVFAIVFLFAVFGCGNSTSPERYGRIVGKVIAQYLKTHETGATFGLQFTDDIDSLNVRLFDSKGALMAQTMTFDGEYSFDGLKPGYYYVKATVNEYISADTTGIYVHADSSAQINPVTLIVKDNSQGLPEEPRVYPNPSNNICLFEFENPTSNQISVKLCNLRGTILSEVIAGEIMPAGTFMISIDLNQLELAEGLYFIGLARGTDIFFRPILYKF